MSRITPERLARRAIVYVRQSSMHRVRHNTGSREWLCDLQARARSLGWQEVAVIEENLGLSGGGTGRPGMQRMLEEVCRNEVGGILAMDATRLARKGRDWHTLLEFWGIVGCLLADLGRRVDLAAEGSVRRGEGDPEVADALKRDAEGE